LNHIFPLPTGDIFSNRMVWFEDEDVGADILIYHLKMRDSAKDAVIPGLQTYTPGLSTSSSSTFLQVVVALGDDKPDLSTLRAF
ncbi:DUF1040 family protein, partial [Escherichia coli]|nr:DUF1040 family protein [Escherichia coli]